MITVTTTPENVYAAVSDKYEYYCITCCIAIRSDCTRCTEIIGCCLVV